MKIVAVGVYLVDALEPCHLIELQISNCREEIDFAEFTQPLAEAPRSNWQVAYDERFLDATGTRYLEAKKPEQQPTVGEYRLVFFFHYFDMGRPLDSQVGPLHLPPPSIRPPRLAFIDYMPP